MNILHVIANLAPRYGGPPRAAQDMCRVLAKRGHHVELFTTNQDGAGVTSVPTNRPVGSDGYLTTYFGVGGPHAYSVSRGLYRALERRITEFDVVEIHGLYLFHTLVGATIARRDHVPYILQPHGGLTRYQRAHHRGRKWLYGILVERRNLNRAAAIHYTAELERQEAEETGIQAPGHVVPLGVDLGFYGHPAREVDLPVGIPRDVPLITFMGRIAEKKGLDITIDALAHVRRMGGRAHLVVAGPDNDGLQALLERRVRSSGLDDDVTFAGTVAGASKVALLQRSHAFVLASLDENFGIAVVEALAAGVPVIISRGVAIHSDIDAAHAGMVVERTCESVAAAILRLLSDEPARREMAAAARTLAGRQFSLDAMGEGLERMYDHVTDAVGAPLVSSEVR